MKKQILLLCALLLCTFHFPLSTLAAATNVVVSSSATLTGLTARVQGLENTLFSSSALWNTASNAAQILTFQGGSYTSVGGVVTLPTLTLGGLGGITADAATNIAINAAGAITIAGLGGYPLANPSNYPTALSVGTDSLQLGGSAGGNNTNVNLFGVLSGGGSNNNVLSGVGYQTLSAGSRNNTLTGLGKYAGALSTNNSYVNFVGFCSGYASHDNTNGAVRGSQAGQSASGNTEFIFDGGLAGYLAQNNSNVIYIGYSAGRNSTGNINTTFFGNQVGLAVYNRTNEVWVGASNQTVYVGGLSLVNGGSTIITNFSQINSGTNSYATNAGTATLAVTATNWTQAGSVAYSNAMYVVWQGGTASNLTLAGVLNGCGVSLTNLGRLVFADGTQVRTNATLVGTSISNGTNTGTMVVSGSATIATNLTVSGNVYGTNNIRTLAANGLADPDGWKTPLHLNATWATPGTWVPTIGNNLPMVVMATNNGSSANNFWSLVPAGATGNIFCANGYCQADAGTNFFVFSPSGITNELTGAWYTGNFFPTNIPTTTTNFVFLFTNSCLNATEFYWHLRRANPAAPGCTNANNVVFQYFKVKWLFP